MELEHQGIISDGVRKEVMRLTSAEQQNEFLHVSLKRSCTEEASINVCNIMIKKKGNPRMQKFGKELKSALEGR